MNDDSSPELIQKDKTIKGAKSLLIVLTIINLFNYLDRYVLSAVLEPIKGDLNIHDDGDMGRLATSFMLGYFLTSPIFGYLGDRFSRRKLMAIGVIGWSLGTCLTGIAQGFSFMIFCRVMVGLGEASFGAIGPAVISDAYSPKRRNTAMTIFYLAIPIGAALGFTLGGLIASTLGWREAFYITGLPGIFLALLLFLVKEPKRGESEYEEYKSKKASIGDMLSLFKNKQYMLAISGYIAYTFSMGALSFWGPTFLSRVHKMTVEESSLFFGPTLILGGIIGTLIGGSLATRWRKKSAGGYSKLLAVSVFLAVPFTIFGFVTDSAAYCMISIAFALIFLFQSSGPINTVLVETVTPAIRSSAMAIAIFCIHAFGDLWSPELVGRISDYSNDLRIGMLILPGAFLLAAIFWAWLMIVQNKATIKV